jgi:hypothetical protein
MIDESMARAETVACAPGDARCYRDSCDIWLDVHTGEGRLRGVIARKPCSGCGSREIRPDVPQTGEQRLHRAQLAGGPHAQGRSWLTVSLMAVAKAPPVVIAGGSALVCGLASRAIPAKQHQVVHQLPVLLLPVLLLPVLLCVSRLHERLSCGRRRRRDPGHLVSGDGPRMEQGRRRSGHILEDCYEASP